MQTIFQPIMMKQTAKMGLAALCAAMSLLPGVARAVQNDAPKEKARLTILSTRGAGGDEEVVEIFTETLRPRFHDPGVPRFVLTGLRKNWALGIGGYVQAKVEYDFDGVVDDIDFYPSLISTDNPRNQFQMDATTSTLFLKLVGRVGSLGPLVVYTAGNWRGDGKTFELQNAYVQFLGFTLGYDTGTFMDLAAEPPTVDYAGPCGMTYYQTTLIRYEHTLGKGLSAGIAVEMPLVNVAADSYVSTARQTLPSVPAYLQYAWGKGQSHVRLSGIYRNMTYTDLSRNRKSCLNGWGVQASAVVAVGRPLQLFMQYAYGKGIGSLINDLSNLNVDMVPYPETRYKMHLLPMSGWYAGAQYNISPALFVSATYSCSRLYTEHFYARENPGDYKQGQYLVANVFWTAVPDLQLGLEYLRGWRTDFDDHIDRANRVNLSAKFSF